MSADPHSEDYGSRFWRMCRQRLTGTLADGWTGLLDERLKTDPWMVMIRFGINETKAMFVLRLMPGKDLM